MFLPVSSLHIPCVHPGYLYIYTSVYYDTNINEINNMHNLLHEVFAYGVSASVPTKGLGKNRAVSTPSQASKAAKKQVKEFRKVMGWWPSHLGLIEISTESWDKYGVI